MIIDRFEGAFAVCEQPDQTMVNIPKELIPADAGEGTVLILLDGKYVIDQAAADDRHAEIKKLMDDLWK